jgi:hypothetical protein
LLDEFRLVGIEESGGLFKGQCLFVSGFCNDFPNMSRIGFVR